MRILLLNDFFLGGGAEAVFRDTTGILKYNNHNVRIFYGSERHSLASNIFEYIFSIENRKKLLKILFEFKPDIIHIHNYHHILTSSIFIAIKRYKKLNKVRVIYTAHDFHLISPSSNLLFYLKGKPKNLPLTSVFKQQVFKNIDNRGILFSCLKKLNWLIEKILIKPENTLDLIITPSFFLLEVFRMNKVKTPCLCIRNPMNMIGPVNLLKYYKKKQAGSLRFVFLGRISPEKGIIDFIQFMVKINADIHLDIIGDGVERSQLLSLINQHSMRNIRLIGAINHDQLMKILPNYDVCILPSVGYENAPLVVPEAALSGLVIFASDLGGIKEICELCHVPYFLYNPLKLDSMRKAFKDIEEYFKKDHETNLSLAHFDQNQYYKSLIDSYIS